MGTAVENVYKREKYAALHHDFEHIRKQHHSSTYDSTNNFRKDMAHTHEARGTDTQKHRERQAETVMQRPRERGTREKREGEKWKSRSGWILRCQKKA